MDSIYLELLSLNEPLEQLYLSLKKLKNIPLEVYQLTKLRSLYLNQNLLTEIPKNIR